MKMFSAIVKVYRTSYGFNVPKAIWGPLGLHSEDHIMLEICKPNGKVLYSDPAQLKSGTEIYGRRFRPFLRLGRKLLIRVSRRSTRDLT